MKKFSTLFPYRSETQLPVDFEELIYAKAFDGLSGSSSFGRGWAEHSPDKRILHVDGITLIRYVSSSRTADPAAVANITEERIKAIVEQGREVDMEMDLEIRSQVSNEIIKYAPIKSKSAYLLICQKDGFVFVSGSTAKVCEDALSFLRHTIDELHVSPWGYSEGLSRAITHNMTTEKKEDSLFSLPDCLVISPFGKTVVTGEDNSLKATFDGVKNDTFGVKSVIEGMHVRSVEMQYIERPENSQINVLADFQLVMPSSGNVHFKKFDYDDDSLAEDGDSQTISEMFLVASYTPKILCELAKLSGLEDEKPGDIEKLEILK